MYIPIEWLADACNAKTILTNMIWAAELSLLVLYGNRVGCPTNLTSFTFNSNFVLQSSAFTANKVDSISSVKPLTWPENVVKLLYFVILQAVQHEQVEILC